MFVLKKTNRIKQEIFLTAKTKIQLYLKSGKTGRILFPELNVALCHILFKNARKYRR